MSLRERIRTYIGFPEVQVDILELRDLLLELKELLMATRQDAAAVVSAITSGVAEETSALDAMDKTLENIANRLVAIESAAKNSGDVPDDIMAQITATSAAIGQNRNHILAQIAKGTSLQGQAPEDPGAPKV